MHIRSFRPLLGMLFCLLVFGFVSSSAAGFAAIPPVSAMPSVKSFGAVGDGRTDDTAAIQRALDAQRRNPDGSSVHNDYFGRPKSLYFPPGVYLVSDTLDWIGCCVALQGAGSDRTAIRLIDSAPGFTNPQSPKPLIRTPAGNMSFRQYVRDLTIFTGRGNPGAIGIDYISSNSGALTDLVIRSADGQGVAGVSMTRQWPGPLLLRRVQIEGFDVGIDVAHAEYGPTFEQIVLRDQRVAGIRNRGNTLAIRGLDSQGAGPAILAQEAYSMLILLDADLRGSSASAAIDSAGSVYLRNVHASGYRVALRHAGNDLPGLSHAAYTSGPIRQLFDSPQRSLELPIRETPATPQVADADWSFFTPRYYGDTQQLQFTFDAGKPAVGLPFGGYLAFNERAVTVPPGVRRVSGFHSVINGDANGLNGGGIRLIIADDSSEPLVIEQFGYGLKIDHRGSRPVVLRNANLAYTSQPGAGDLYLEDVELEPLVIQPGQRVWARQFNNEYGGTKIVNQGGDLWILGLKTERTGTVIETTGGGRSELLGTLIYPSRPFNSEEQQQAAFVSRDSSMSLMYAASVYCDGCHYPYQVEETRNGETRRLAGSTAGERMPLFVGFSETVSDNMLPNVILSGAPLAGKLYLLTAQATDPDGAITAVDFYVNDELIAVDRIAPYCLNVANPTDGMTVRATAHDNREGAKSSTVALQVEPSIEWNVYLPALGDLGATPGAPYDNPFGTVSECVPS